MQVWLEQEAAGAQRAGPAELPPAAACVLCVWGGVAGGRNLFGKGTLQLQGPFPPHFSRRFIFLSDAFPPTHFRLAAVTDRDVYAAMTVPHSLLHLISNDNSVSLGLFLFTCNVSIKANLSNPRYHVGHLHSAQADGGSHACPTLPRWSRSSLLYF